MTHIQVPARLAARDTFPDMENSLGRRDGWLVREGANWLISRNGPDVLMGRISADASRIFSERWSWPEPDPDGTGYSSPVPGGGLAVSGSRAVTLIARDGEVRWVYQHEAWSEGGMGCGACAADPSGRYLFATTVGRLDAGAPYEGDLCVAIDLATGKLVAESVLPSFSGMYDFQHSLADDEDAVFLMAGQGQDEAYSLLVSLSDGEVVVRQAGVIDEPFTGNSLASGVFLKQAIDGEDLTRYEGGLPVATTSAEAVLSADVRFVGRPGFLDDSSILAAVAEEEWAEEARHFLLDAHTLEPMAEIDYPATTSLDPLALGDGTWLTVEGDEVSRWRIS